jgi:hypothetical protein
MKAGMKKKAVAATAQRENAGHSQGNGRRWVMNSECDEKLMDLLDECTMILA